MATNKLMALIGNILFSLNNLVVLVFGGVGLFFLASFQNVNTSTVTSNGSVVAVTRGSILIHSVDGQSSSFYLAPYATLLIVLLVFGLLLTLVANVFTWLAFAKLGGPHDKGWRIFLLVMGILNVGTFFSGIFFILAFALKGSVAQETQKASVS